VKDGKFGRGQKEKNPRREASEGGKGRWGGSEFYRPNSEGSLDKRTKQKRGEAGLQKNIGANAKGIAYKVSD